MVSDIPASAKVTSVPAGPPADRRAILAAHASAMERGDDGYLDPVNGLFVFTAAYLLARGACCDTGCRHCPYVA
ncbi:hypothetical protein BH24ACT3_BH24ACT3_04750 [soil metagenome]